MNKSLQNVFNAHSDDFNNEYDHLKIYKFLGRHACNYVKIVKLVLQRVYENILRSNFCREMTD